MALYKCLFIIIIKIPTQRKEQAQNGVIQTCLESKRGTSAIFHQMGHHQTNTSWQKWKAKQHSVPKGKANDYVGRSKNILNRRFKMFSKCCHAM